MDQCNSVHNPVVPGFKLTKDKEGVEVDSTLYKQMVGSLMYLTATRPDLMFIVSLISRYMERPTEFHLLAAKRALRYVKGTVSFGMFYPNRGREELIGYMDVRFHFLRNLVRDGVVELIQCSTQDQVADVLTKPLKLDVFLKMRGLLGVCEHPGVN